MKLLAKQHSDAQKKLAGPSQRAERRKRRLLTEHETRLGASCSDRQSVMTEASQTFVSVPEYGSTVDRKWSVRHVVQVRPICAHWLPEMSCVSLSKTRHNFHDRRRHLRLAHPE